MSIRIKFNIVNIMKIKKLIWLVALLLGLALLCFLVIKFNGVFWPKKDKNPPVNQTASTLVKYQDFHLEIPKLNLNAPIIADVPGDNKEAYFKALENGVAHFAGTKKPGEGGNIFIFGHSSFYSWAAGDYKEIFKDLEQVSVGDEISVWYNQKEYKYKVTETKVVDPMDTSVLEPTTEEQLVLMTCVPPGTKEKRLIVIAKPIK